MILNEMLVRILKTPPYLILFVSDKCWMRCSHCWYHEIWKSQHHKREPLEFTELSKLAKSMPSVSFLSLTGGEAFLREDIVKITKMFCSSTNLKRYDIPTSGYEPDMILDKVLEMLRINPGILFRVGVSLDGTQEVHDQIRGVDGGFARAIRTIELLKRVKKSHSNFDMGIITTISRSNQHQVKRISELISDIYPEGEWQVNMVRGATRDPQSADVSLESYKLADRLIEDRIEKGRFGGHRSGIMGPWLSAKNSVRRKVILDNIFNNCSDIQCAAGTLGGVVFIDGETYPCELYSESMGNIKDYNCDLSLLWNSNKAKQIRERIRKTGCWCTQECFLTVSLLISPRKWPSVIRERIRLFKAGRFLK